MIKYLYYILWTLFILGILILLGFVDKAHQNIACSKVKININNTEDNFFIDEQDVADMLPFDPNKLDSVTIGSVQAEIIEKKLNNHPAILNAEVYQSLNGDLEIFVDQRRPIARVFPSNGESFYLDEKGRLMPLSQKFTSRVMVISGNFGAKYDQWYLHNMNEVYLDDSLSRMTILDDLYQLAQYIFKNTFWEAQIEQLYVNKDSEVELIPRVGNHTIVFGEVDDIEKKLNKLMLFYKKGLSKTGWNEYSVINLKFDNQVVCTKRY